ncbi:hypothetical protein K504DRAFT_539141 [Pleomassaria siparia CBS 279.74]|uniref:Mid2 domain-containing protein n=1 Tax=Pleomassaria siparia CBS 279.74 TaxID=1314801 RepID=A0A6G1JR91_9PLEO|nr:hypothetical protein K504DRAFT_539141 [Pleomassaria siparia CBS 279.74]
MSTTLASSNTFIRRALNDPNLANNAVAELMNLVVRKTKKTKKTKKKIKAGAIIGIVIGIVVLILILCIILFLVRKRSQKKKKKILHDGQNMQTVV